MGQAPGAKTEKWPQPGGAEPGSKCSPYESGECFDGVSVARASEQLLKAEGWTRYFSSQGKGNAQGLTSGYSCVQ